MSAKKTSVHVVWMTDAGFSVGTDWQHVKETTTRNSGQTTRVDVGAMSEQPTVRIKESK